MKKQFTEECSGAWRGQSCERGLMSNRKKRKQSFWSPASALTTSQEGASKNSGLTQPLPQVWRQSGMELGEKR